MTRRRKEGVSSQCERAGTPAASPGKCEFLKLRGKSPDEVVDDLKVVKAWGRSVKVPGLYRDVELPYLPPTPCSGWRSAESWQVAEVVEGRRVHARERELVQLGERSALEGDPEAHQRIIDNVSPVPLLGVLAWGLYRDMPDVGQELHRVDEGGHVAGSVKERRILLCKDLTEFRVGILGSQEGRCHGRVGGVEEAYLAPGLRMDERREKGGIRVGEVECKVFDVMANSGEGLYPAGFGEGVCCERQVCADEEPLGDKVAAGRVGKSDGAYVLLL